MMEAGIDRTLPIRLGRVHLEALEAGPAKGPPVILLHGFPETAWAWRKQIPALAKAGFRCLAPDQRGYNRSSKPRELADYHLDRLADDVIALADERRFSRVRLVGHDWGGLVAWWVATRYPERVERFAILNAPHPSTLRAYLPSHPTQAMKSSYIGFFQLPWLPEKLLGARDFALLERTLRESSRGGAFADDAIQAYREAWAQPEALKSMLNWYRALRLFKVPSDLPKIRPPTLILWGCQDAFLESGLANASAAQCEQAEIVWLKKATHWLHLEEPELINARLINFFHMGSPIVH